MDISSSCDDICQEITVPLQLASNLGFLTGPLMPIHLGMQTACYRNCRSIQELVLLRLTVYDSNIRKQWLMAASNEATDILNTIRYIIEI